MATQTGNTGSGFRGTGVPRSVALGYSSGSTAAPASSAAPATGAGSSAAAGNFSSGIGSNSPYSAGSYSSSALLGNYGASNAAAQSSLYDRSSLLDRYGASSYYGASYLDRFGLSGVYGSRASTLGDSIGYGSTIAPRYDYSATSAATASPVAVGTSVRSVLPAIRGEDLPPIREAPIRLPYVPRQLPPVFIYDDLPPGIRERVMEQNRLRGIDTGFTGATYQAPSYNPAIPSGVTSSPTANRGSTTGSPAPAAAPATGAAPSTASDSEWQEVRDPESGRPYYWNRRTNETRW